MTPEREHDTGGNGGFCSIRSLPSACRRRVAPLMVQFPPFGDDVTGRQVTHGSTCSAIPPVWWRCHRQASRARVLVQRNSPHLMVVRSRLGAAPPTRGLEGPRARCRTHVHVIGPTCGLSGHGCWRTEIGAPRRRWREMDAGEPYGYARSRSRSGSCDGVSTVR